MENTDMLSGEGGACAWDGPKTERLNIRVTETEKQELMQKSREYGDLGIGRYLLQLHRLHTGKVRELSL